MRLRQHETSFNVERSRVYSLQRQQMKKSLQLCGMIQNTENTFLN